jgi:hypothetical protein
MSNNATFYAHNLEVRDKTFETMMLCRRQGKSAVETLLTLILLHQEVIPAVALHGIFSATCLPDALLCAAVGPDFWHVPGNPNEEWGFCKEKHEKAG